MYTITLLVTRIEKAAAEAILVYLQPQNQEPVDYEAGQFFTFIIHHYGREIRRSYSIATTPGIDLEMAVVIKRMENGEISRYLIDTLVPGAVLTALHPAGRFTLNTQHESRMLFFIAAGSGISPVYALIKKALYLETTSTLVLIYQNRNEESIIFKQALEALQQQHSKRFSVIHLLSEPADRRIRPQRLNNLLLEKLLSAHFRPEVAHWFYLCGAASFMRMVTFVLRLTGIQEAYLRRENFVVDAVPPPPFFTDDTVKNISLRWKGRQYRFEAQYPLSILQAALNNNIPLPFSCRGGRCSACTVKCITGTVKMSINEVLTDNDLRLGWVLTCVGYAATDLVLEL